MTFSIENKPEYGTPEYWEKERKSKFIKNARQKEMYNERFSKMLLKLYTQTKLYSKEFSKFIDELGTKA